MQKPPLIHAWTEGKAGRISLNRGHALHALNLEMCQTITQILKAWMVEPEIDFVILDHMANTRGFCAGGDVAMLANSGAHDGREAEEFFQTEYRLNDLISKYPKPVIAFMDGVTMGGGVGLAIHARFRVATERTIFAMPETGIGLIPDVGGTWFLPRMDGELGTWLALTGARLKGKDVIATGLATHFCLSAEVEALKANLALRGLRGLNQYLVDADFSLNEHVPEINLAFRGDSVRQICAELANGSWWAQEQSTRINAKSPLSTRVTLRQLRTGPYLGSLRAALRLEYRIVKRMIRTSNFREGVRACVIDKDHTPRWYPASMQLVTRDEVSRFFSPLGDDELKFLDWEMS